MDLLNPDKAFTRQQPVPSAEKTFPVTMLLDVRLSFSPEDMQKVRTWYENTRRELGDKFVADFSVDRLMYEALTGGAVNPSIIFTRFAEPEPVRQTGIVHE